MILSIIVPVYNVERYLGRCLESLLRQDLMPDTYEIILVDDKGVRINFSSRTGIK